VRVQVLPPGGHFALKQIDEMWNLHCGHLRRGCANAEGQL
jgi:hypothetical protein